MNIVIYGVGGLLAIAGLMRWWRGSRRDPLGDVPPRPSRFGPETVGIAMLIYFLGVTVCLQIADELVGQANIDEEVAAPLDGETLAAEDDAPAEDEASPEPNLAGIAAGNAAQLIGWVGCLALATLSFDGGARRFLLGSQGSAWAIGAAVALAVVSIPLCDGLVMAATWVLEYLGRSDLATRQHSVIQTLLNDSPRWWGVGVLWVGAVVIAPLAEEAFFRGILQTTVSKVIGGRWLAVFCSAIAFGAGHAVGQPQAVPALIVLGILLGAVYERTGSLVAPILLHGLFNLKTMLWVTWGQA